MFTKRGLAAAGAAAAASIAIFGVAGSPAQAAGKDGVVDSGEFGLYYVTGSSGLVFDLFVSDNNFSGDVFPGTSISANDNTESYRNRDSFYWHVFTAAGYGGSHGCLSAGYVGNASATYKNTISSAFYSSSSC
jgi:hypothetical protein